MPPGGSRELKVVLTTVLGGDLNMLDNTDFQIDSEIMSYRDNGANTSRRMAITKAKEITIGDSKKAISYLKALFPANNKEHDYSITQNNLFITPPLGQEKRQIIGYIVSVLALLPLVIYGLFILAKRAKHKNK